MKEWKKQHPAKVRQQKKSYRERNKDKWRDELKRWRIKNPEKVRTQKRRYRKRKAWPRILGIRQKRQKKDLYDPDEILRGLFEVRVELTDYRKTPTQPPPPPPP